MRVSGCERSHVRVRVPVRACVQPPACSPRVQPPLEPRPRPGRAAATRGPDVCADPARPPAGLSGLRPLLGNLAVFRSQQAAACSPPVPGRCPRQAPSPPCPFSMGFPRGGRPEPSPPELPAGSDDSLRLMSSLGSRASAHSKSRCSSPNGKERSINREELTQKLFPDAPACPHLPDFMRHLVHVVSEVALGPGFWDRFGKDPHLPRTAGPTACSLRLADGSGTGADFCPVQGVNVCVCMCACACVCM